MSTFTVPIVEYASQEHPNADALELAMVAGWRCVSRLGQFQTGDKVAYIPEQSVLPDDLIAEMGLEGRLSGKKKNRVKAIRLRGVVSQGLIYGGDRIASLEIGDDAAETLGVTKYEPEIPGSMNGVLVAGPQVGFDIEDIKWWEERFVDGEEVVVTEKLHGTYCCIGLAAPDGGTLSDGPVEVAASKGRLAKGLRFDVDAEENANNWYVKAWHDHKAAVYAIADSVDAKFQVLVMGEVFGKKIQDLQYGLTAPQFRVFDIKIDSKFLPFPQVVELCEEHGVDTVPVLWTGPWSKGCLTPWVDGPTTISDGPHVREGVVVKTTTPRYDTGIDHPSASGPGRMIVKMVSDDYLFRQGNKTEYQ